MCSVLPLQLFGRTIQTGACPVLILLRSCERRPKESAPEQPVTRSETRGPDLDTPTQLLRQLLQRRLVQTRD